MLGTGPEQRFSQYSMHIECPQCGEKMGLQIGLTGGPKNERLKCIGCYNEILPLMPGPIVGGPFAVEK